MAEEQVADRAPDEVHIRATGEARQHDRAAGQIAQAVEEVGAAHDAVSLGGMLTRKRALLAAALMVIAALGGLGAYLLLLDEPKDVSNPEVEFVEAPPTAPPQRAPKRAKDPFDDGFAWPVVGFTKAQTRYVPTSTPLRPPFRERWARRGSVLLEFNPVLCGDKLYLLKNNGALYAIARRTGKVRWKRKLGYLAASAPACGHGTVYATLLLRFKGAKGGRVVAVSARNGRTRWSRKLPSRAESSPLLHRGHLYFGTEDGTVYGLRSGDGFVRWRYRAAGAVKAALSLDRGTLFFGDYGGQFQAIRARDGSRVWRASSGSALRSGNFYATAAVAYGRAYVGSTDGR